MHQKDGVNDDDFEPYISSQTNQVTNYNLMIVFLFNSDCDMFFLNKMCVTICIFQIWDNKANPKSYCGQFGQAAGQC